MPLAAVPWVTRPARKVRKRTPAKPKTPALPEWLLQSYLISEFNALEATGWQLRAEGDMNAARRSYQEAAKCKAMGMRSGTADIRLYGAGAKLLPIEVKTPTGKMSQTQTDWHTRMGQLGFLTLVVAPTDEAHARSLAREIATKFVGGVL